MRLSVSHPTRSILFGGIGGVLLLAVTGAVLVGCSGGVEPIASASPVVAAPADAAAAAAVRATTATPTPVTPPSQVQPPVDPPAPAPEQQGAQGQRPQPGGASEPATGANGLPDVAAQPAWKVGESRPYTLNTHCGIKTAKIGSEMWSVTEPAKPVSGDRLSGTMTLVEPFLARFTWDAGTADFAPPTAPTQLCS